MRVLFVSGMAGDTRRYRCAHHQEQLALHNIESVLLEADDMQAYVDATTHDLFILHRAPYSDLIADLIEIAHLRGKPVLFETDDLIFEPDLYGAIGFIDTLSPDVAYRFRQDLVAQAKTFAQSDFILTTTQYLADAAARRGKVAFVQRNAFSHEMIRASEVAYETVRQAQEAAQGDDGLVEIGYFSGTGSHNRDFASITSALVEVMKRYPHVWLHVSGHLDMDNRLQPYRQRIRRAPYVAWQELPHLIARVDINLAPLELDNPFCQAKSEIKYTEAALVGVPTVASPTDAFAYAIQHGENGLLARTTDEWLAALVALVEDPSERRRLGENARQHVYRDYTPQVRSQHLVEILDTAMELFAPAAKEDRAATTVAQAMKRQFHGLLQKQQQLELQVAHLRQTLAQWEANRIDDRGEFWRREFESSERRHAGALKEILERFQARKL